MIWVLHCFAFVTGVHQEKLRARDVQSRARFDGSIGEMIPTPSPSEDTIFFVCLTSHTYYLFSSSFATGEYASNDTLLDFLFFCVRIAGFNEYSV